jgi:hypothetical protein
VSGRRQCPVVVRRWQCGSFSAAPAFFYVFTHKKHAQKSAMAGLISKEYLEFFTEFVNELNVHDQLPVPVSAYNVDDEELVGDFVNWSLQYLNQK